MTFGNQIAKRLVDMICLQANMRPVCLRIGSNPVSRKLLSARRVPPFATERATENCII